MRAKKVSVLIIFLVFTLLTACANTNKSDSTDYKSIPVKVITAKEETKVTSLKYLGMIASEETKKLGFKSGGKLESVSVEKGQRIKMGTEVARLDTKELQLAVDAAKGQLDAAKAQYDKALRGATKEEIANGELNMKKAKDAYIFAKDNFEKIKILYKEGGVSRQELDRIKLELDIRESEYNQATEVYNQLKNGSRQEDKKAAQGMWEQASSDYEYKKSMLEDAILISDIDGHVIDVLYEEGELIPQGYPIVILQNENKIAKTGLSQEDMNKVKIGDKVVVNVDGEIIDGEISNISEVPDNQTRTFETQVRLTSNSIKVGSIARLNIIVGKEKGIWIPIKAIMTDGEDYVYVSRENIVERQSIIVRSLDGDMVKVEGLEDGMKIIVENIKQVDPGDRITISE